MFNKTIFIPTAIITFFVQLQYCIIKDHKGFGFSAQKYHQPWFSISTAWQFWIFSDSKAFQQASKDYLTNFSTK